MDAKEIAHKVLADWLCWDVGSIIRRDEADALERRIVMEIEKAVAEDKSQLN